MGPPGLGRRGRGRCQPAVFSEGPPQEIEVRAAGKRGGRVCWSHGDRRLPGGTDGVLRDRERTVSRNVPQALRRIPANQGLFHDQCSPGPRSRVWTCGVTQATASASGQRRRRPKQGWKILYFRPWEDGAAPHFSDISAPQSLAAFSGQLGATGNT